ncbi:hypothetical protein GCM10023321_78460 [Pseudonocardia eucalypti]|uniref:Beta-lactamase-related domain-containing protein n=1 Tax=Pseudonocardia eucalypti TaxID=648755 RepID=A0ABP9RBD9_9PSEU|nr:CubicO group peptidase (beta-lactamase class C family) [Pseudonocardia eucalypti]
MITRRKLLHTVALAGTCLAAGVGAASCAPTRSASTVGEHYGLGSMTDELTEFLDDRGFSGTVLLEHRGCTVVSAAYGHADHGKRPFADVVRDHVFTPAGMRDTIVVHPDTPGTPVAIRYASAGRPVRRAVTTGAGGYYTTVTDLVAFARALLGHRLLDERHTDEVIGGRNGVRGGRGGLYSYGCSTKTLEGHRVVEHNGGSPGANAWLRIYPDDGFTLAALCNVHERGSVDGVKPIVDKVQELITKA